MSCVQEGNIVATGEIGSPLAKVLVWNCSDTGSSRSTATNPKNNNTMEILFSEGNFHQHGVIHVTFSPDGKLLGTIGNDKYHSLAVYRWEDSTILFTSRVSEGNCLCCAFMDDASSSSTTFAVGGDSFLYFWSKVTEGYALRPGNFSLHSSKQPITCLAALQLRGAAGSGGAAVSAAGGAAGVGTDQMVSGTASGQLLLWVDRNCVKVVKAHEGAVSTIYSSVHCILTGGKDQRIRQWTLKLEPGATFNISPFGRNPSVRSICMSSDGTTVLFGTRGADIYEVSWCFVLSVCCEQLCSRWACPCTVRSLPSTGATCAEAPSRRATAWASSSVSPCTPASMSSRRAAMTQRSASGTCPRTP